MTIPSPELKRLTLLIRALAKDGANVEIGPDFALGQPGLDLANVLALLQECQVVSAEKAPGGAIAVDLEAEWDEQAVDGHVHYYQVKASGMYASKYDDLHFLIIQKMTMRER